MVSLFHKIAFHCAKEILLKKKVYPLLLVLFFLSLLLVCFYFLFSKCYFFYFRKKFCRFVLLLVCKMLGVIQFPIIICVSVEIPGTPGHAAHWCEGWAGDGQWRSYEHSHPLLLPREWCSQSSEAYRKGKSACHLQNLGQLVLLRVSAYLQCQAELALCVVSVVRG
jgi:hypothetical protein